MTNSWSSLASPIPNLFAVGGMQQQQPTIPTPNTPTVCLNMIVKNESSIILRLLESVYPYIDSFVLCDTGSTDDTIALITQFFTSLQTNPRNIQGKILEEPFRDFGYNRAFALKACSTQIPQESNTATHILLLDADMKFECFLSPLAFRQKLASGQPAFYMFQGTAGSFFYKNVRIVENYRDFSYWGVTHEYVECPPGIEGNQFGFFTLEESFIHDIGDGGCKTTKFERDIQLLLKGLEEHPKNDRYTFYLANSYHDAGQKEKAIQAYQDRIALGGWMEEVWYSYYQLGKLYLHSDPDSGFYNVDKALGNLLGGYEAYPDRMENIYELVKFYREQGKYKLANVFYNLADNIRKQHQDRVDYLFWQRDVYSWKLDYEWSILGYYVCPRKADLLPPVMQLLTKHEMWDACYQNVLANTKFYAPCLTKVCGSQAKGWPWPEIAAPQDEGFYPSTPTLCFVPSMKSILVGTRYVNYRIDDQGNYINQDKIVSKTLMYTFAASPTDPFRQPLGPPQGQVLTYDTQYDGRYVGPEDVRFFATNQGQVVYNANRGVCGNGNENGDTQETQEMVVEVGTLDIRQNHLGNTKILHKMEQPRKRIEKNWVLFQRDEKDVFGIYKFSPLEIGRVSIEHGIFYTCSTTPSSDLPRFFQDLRGSTNGLYLEHNQEIWFLTHLVSYEHRRFYYHCCVVLDATTFRVKKYTPLWTFEESPVEYTLGWMTRGENNDTSFLIGYSVLDRHTKFIEVSKHWFEHQLLTI